MSAIMWGSFVIGCACLLWAIVSLVVMKLDEMAILAFYALVLFAVVWIVHFAAGVPL